MRKDNADMKKIVDEGPRLRQAVGDLRKLISEGDKSIKKDGTIDLDVAFAELRARRARPKVRR
jgi:hypothetical protein